MVAVMRISARASRDGKFWLVYVPEVDQYTQGCNLKEARLMARDLAASLRGVPLAEIELAQFTVELPGEVRSHLSHAGELRKRAQEANRAAAEEVRVAARQLRDSGLTVRDIGDALDVSYQRAHQLVTAD